MQNVKTRLDAWREAEHRRDGRAPGSAERQDAEDEVHVAEKAFHAELAQESARYAEAERTESGPRWSGRVDRLTQRAGD